MNKPYKEIQKDAEQALLDLRVASVEIGKRIATERIIKLLEADGLNCDCDWCQINGDVPSQHHWRILRLIKGEWK